VDHVTSILYYNKDIIFLKLHTAETESMASASEIRRYEPCSENMLSESNEMCPNPYNAHPRKQSCVNTWLLLGILFLVMEFLHLGDEMNIVQESSPENNVQNEREAVESKQRNSFNTK
jgi:hypothetical protein